MQTIIRISRIALVIGAVALLSGCTRTIEPGAAPAAASPDRAGDTLAATEAPALTCKPPFRTCIGCTGAPICAIRCPECPPPATSRPAELPAELALAPAVETCGGVQCRPGTFCCNPSCGICTPKGVSCTQQSCN